MFSRCREVSLSEDGWSDSEPVCMKYIYPSQCVYLQITYIYSPTKYLPMPSEETRWGKAAG